MKNGAKISFFTALFFTLPAFAFHENSFGFDKPDSAELELKLSVPGEWQRLAAVCFLGIGCGDEAKFAKVDDNFAIDTVNQCKNEGFTVTSCSLPSYPNVVCTYNPNYYAECKEDKPRACKEAGYVTSCGTGYVLDTSQTCPYDSSYKKCKCDPCSGYDYTYDQATATGYVADGFCMSCGTTKYKRKNNPCIGYNVCECGGESGSASCTSGTVQKFDTCHPCCENKCSLVSCPENHACDYEACSNKYCDKGCASGYTDMCTYYNANGAQSCTKMGYRLQSCTGDTVLCPYDTTYKFCM